MKLTTKELKQITDKQMYKDFTPGKSMVTPDEKKIYNAAIMDLADKLTDYCTDRQ